MKIAMFLLVVFLFTAEFDTDFCKNLYSLQSFWYPL